MYLIEQHEVLIKQLRLEVKQQQLMGWTRLSFQKTLVRQRLLPCLLSVLCYVFCYIGVHST